MGNLRFSSLAAAFVLFALPAVVAEIRSMRIVRDPRPIILFEQFGFSAGGGRVSVSVKGVSWKSPEPAGDPRRWMGFVLIRQVSYERLENESRYSSGGFCSLSSRYVEAVLPFQSLAADSTGNGSAAVEQPDEYSLLFINCLQGIEVSMEVRTEMYNVGVGGERDYLPAGHKPLPRLYFVFSVVYAAFLAGWVAVCFRQRSTVETIHVIMGMLLAFKALKLVCAAEDVSFVGRTGTPHGWDVVFYIFGFLKGVTLFTVIVLIGTGWSFLKPYLQVLQ